MSDITNNLLLKTLVSELEDYPFYLEAIKNSRLAESVKKERIKNLQLKREKLVKVISLVKSAINEIKKSENKK